MASAVSPDELTSLSSSPEEEHAFLIRSKAIGKDKKRLVVESMVVIRFGEPMEMYALLADQKLTWGVNDMERGRERQHLGKLPVKAEVITERELKEALEEQRISGLHLKTPLEEGHVTETELARALSVQRGYPRSLSRLRPTSEALNLLPEAAAKRLEVVPLSVMDNRIVVATAEPLDVLALDEVGC